MTQTDALQAYAGECIFDLDVAMAGMVAYASCINCDVMLWTASL